MSGKRRVIIDSDTAGDDTQAILLAALSDRIKLEGVTIGVGNVPFDRQVENAKYTLQVAGVEDEIEVHEGIDAPLLKEHRTAEYVHGEGGLGGNLHPDTGIPSANEHAVDYIVRMARENPGEITLVCIGPLTNLAMALQREPRLDDLLDEVLFMGLNANGVGNVTPAASYNVWVDPDAAKAVVENMRVTTVGVEVCYTERQDSMLYEEELERIESAVDESPYAEFYTEIAAVNRAGVRERHGFDGTTNPDSLTIATLLEPSIVEDSGVYHVAIDEREGLTRGYSLVDERGETDHEPRTHVVHAADRDRFARLMLDMLVHGNPDRSRGSS